MPAPLRGFSRRARAAHRENRVMLGQPFRLYEKISERPVSPVVDGGSEYDFLITRELQPGHGAAEVRDRHAPGFTNAIGKTHDLEHCLYLVVLPADRRADGIETGLI